MRKGGCSAAAAPSTRRYLPAAAPRTTTPGRMNSAVRAGRSEEIRTVLCSLGGQRYVLRRLARGRRSAGCFVAGASAQIDARLRTGLPAIRHPLQSRFQRRPAGGRRRLSDNHAKREAMLDRDRLSEARALAAATFLFQRASSSSASSSRTAAPSASR